MPVCNVLKKFADHYVIYKIKGVSPVKNLLCIAGFIRNDKITNETLNLVN